MPSAPRSVLAPSRKRTAAAAVTPAANTGKGKAAKAMKVEASRTKAVSTSKSSRGSGAVAGHMPAEAWKRRQCVARELQAADKVIVPWGQLNKHVSDENGTITANEALAILVRCEARLSPDLRWIYTGDDLEDLDNYLIILTTKANVNIKQIKNTV